MFLGYCLDPVSHTWFPPVPLTTPEACWSFCLRYHHSTPEIRIVDLDGCLVLHVQHHLVKCPLKDGYMGLIDLRDGGRSLLTTEPAATVPPPALDPDLRCESCEQQPWTQLAKWHEALVCRSCAANEPRPGEEL